MALLLWPSGSQLQLLGILAALIFASIYGVLLPGYFRQVQTPRSHNNVRLLNECLANYQLIYLPFYLSFKRFVRSDTEEWMDGLILTLILLTLIFAAYGLFKLFTQDRTLSRIHDSCAGPECEMALSGSTKWKLYGLNLVFGVVSLGIAVALSFSTLIKDSKVPPPTDQGSKTQSVQNLRSKQKTNLEWPVPSI